MELLADEMQDFQKGLLQLKKMNDDLQARSIPINTEVMEKHLNFFFQKQQEKERMTLENLNAIDQKLTGVYIIPKYIAVLFGSIVLSLILAIGYLSFELVQSKEDKTEVLQEGSGPLNEHQAARQEN